MLDNILKATKPFKCRIIKNNFPLSSELFGAEVLAKLPMAQGALADIVKVISKYEICDFTIAFHDPIFTFDVRICFMSFKHTIECDCHVILCYYHVVQF